MARLSLVPKDCEFFNLFDEAGANILHAAQLLGRLIKAWPEAGGPPAARTVRFAVE